jgi:glycerol-3-phosphate acyltransferase PlsX
MKIALDAMGGDFAPENNIRGAIEYVGESRNSDVVLVGDEDPIRKCLSGCGYSESRITIVHASEVIPMDASPSHAIRRMKDSSLRKAVGLVRDGAAGAAVSAGNSGAMMALGMFLLGVSEGVDRPAIATLMPSFTEPFLLLDAGANVDCSPENLLQFALMSDAYCRHVMHRPNPRIAILSIGEEPGKGNELTKESYKLISRANINFIGNIESKDAFMGKADAVVCDGFVGNIFLKTSEGLADVVMKMLKREINNSAAGKLGFLMMRPAIKNFKKITDYDEYGGAPLLGINGSCFISHGRSTPKAIKNALKFASEFSALKVFDAVSNEIRDMGVDGKKIVVAG